MKKLILVNLLMFFSWCVQAQYTAHGKIEYERKINIQRTIDDMDKEDKEWIEKFRSQMPKFNISYFNLYFNTTGSLYKPGKETDNPVKMWFAQTPASENIVYTDFKTQKVTANKVVYEEKFLVQDTMRKVQWRITDEIRMIANYKCRKAVGKMFDSVYIVAFYSEDIMVNGGPEMFSGLPGMILELAIPRLFTTWIATNVDIATPNATDMVAPAKGKKVNQEGVYDAVKGTFKRWGKFAERNVWWTLI